LHDVKFWIPGLSLIYAMFEASLMMRILQTGMMEEDLL